MDKFGLRPVMLMSIVLFALNVAAIALSNTLAVFILLVAATGITGVGQGPIGYIKSISSYFDRQRGIAIGIAVSGTGLGTALLPQYAQWLITNMGWRMAYVGLAIVLVIIAVPSVFLFVREPEDSPIARARRAASGVAILPGLSVNEAVLSRTFWLLVGPTFLVATVINGSLVHVVSLLTDRGWSPEAAAGIMVWAGLASLGGRVVAGWMLDRVFAPYVAILSFMVALAGLYLLASGSKCYSWSDRNRDNHWSRSGCYRVHDFAVFRFAKVCPALWLFVRCFPNWYGNWARGDGRGSYEAAELRFRILCVWTHAGACNCFYALFGSL